MRYLLFVFGLLIAAYAQLTRGLRRFSRALRVGSLIQFIRGGTGVAAVLSTLLVFGCGNGDSVLEYLGLRNAPEPAAVELDVLCDYGGAPCTPERLRVVAEAAFAQTALRPGSVVRLWWLGNAVGDTALIGSMTIPPCRGASRRAREAHQAQVIAAGRAAFEKASAPLFADFRRRRSPILESLGKIAMASGSRSREVWLVSDLLEENLYRFECDALPDERSFRQTVAPILPHDSLRDVQVYAIFAAPSTIDRDRCPVYIPRFRAITALFEAAVGQAGGQFHLSPTTMPTIGAN
jgi:hypothetical protein